MALYYPGCPTDITDPQCSDCPSKELGDIRSIFFFKNDFVDITSTAEWTSGIEAGTIYVFPYTRGTLEVAETMSEGFGDQDEALDGFTYTVNAIDPTYKNNWGFWNTFKGSQRWKVGYRTESLVHASSKTAIVVPKAPIAEGKKSAIRWNVTIKFTQDNIPEPQTMPTGVFDQCIDV